MRDDGIDTLKGMMIVLVVVGHYIEHLLFDPRFRLLYSIIYVVHMPVFVYLSGVTFSLSKGKRSVGFILFCIMVGQLSYSAVSMMLYGNPWTDYWILWFLYAMLAWRALTPFMPPHAGILLPALLAALLWGLMPQNDVWRFTRIIGYYPFFLAGYQQLHRRFPRQGSRWLVYILGLISGVFVVKQAVRTVESVAVVYYSQSYQVLGQSVMAGMVYKLLLYAAGTGAVLFFLRRCFHNGTLAKWGRHSVMIYLAHGSLAKVISKALQITNPALLIFLALATAAIFGTTAANNLIRGAYARVSALWTHEAREA